MTVFSVIPPAGGGWGETVDNIFDSHITSPQLVAPTRTYKKILK
jgi:hypothetical protein